MRFVLPAVLILAASGCAHRVDVLNDPITILNRWDKLDATVPGTGLDVQLETGMTIRGTFQASTADELRITIDRGNPMSIAKADVLQITAADTDSLKDGALWGLGIGGLLALGAGLSGGGQEVDGTAEVAATNFIWAFGLGLLLDWQHQEREVIYIRGGRT